RVLDRLNSEAGVTAVSWGGARLSGAKRGAGRWILLVLLSPLAMLGFLGNYPPIGMAKANADKGVKHPDFWAPVFMSIAVALTSLWYLLWIVAGMIFGCAWLALALAAIGLSGILYIRWYRPLWKGALPGPDRRIDPGSGTGIDQTSLSMLHFLHAALKT